MALINESTIGKLALQYNPCMIMINVSPERLII